MELRPLRFNSFPATATATRADALQWLSYAENCLSIRNLFGSKTFATKARDFDPGLYPAEQMLAVADTLIAGDIRIGGGSLRDWYGVLRLPQGSTSPPELISHEYHNLIGLLHPQKNKYPYADRAFGLVVEAWTVLSHPLRKSQYDKELALYFQQSQPFIDNLPAMQQDFVFPRGNAAPANPQVQQDFVFPRGNAAPANPQVQPDLVYPGGNAAPANPQVQQDFVIPGGSAAPANPQVQQDFVIPEGSAALPNPQVQQDFVYPGGNAAPPAPQMQQDFVYPGGNAALANPPLQQDFVIPGGSAAPANPPLQQDFVIPGGSAAPANPPLQQDFVIPGGSAAPANPQVQQDFVIPGGSAALPNPQVQQDFVIPGGSAALPTPQMQQDFVYPGGNAAPPTPQMQQDFVYPGGNAAPPTPQMQQDFVFPGGNAAPPNPQLQQDFVYPGGNAAPPNPQMQQDFVFPGGNAASPTPQMHVEFQQVNGNQPQMVAPMMSSGATEEFQSFMPFDSDFLFGSGSGAGDGSSHEYANNGVQENVFSGFVGGGDMCAAPFVNQNQVNGCNDMQNQQQENYACNSDTANFNVNGCNDMQNQQQEYYVYNSDTTNFNVNANENVGGMRQDEAADLGEMDKLEGKTLNDESLDGMVNKGAGGESTFWTACPYCYHMYEYPSAYKDCSLRCQKCKCAFHGLMIQSPPSIVEGQESYYCGWASAPMGFSKENPENNKAAESTWTPFSSMFAASSIGNTNNAKKKRGGWNSGPRVYIDDDDFHVDISSPDSSADDWQNGGDQRKKARNAKGKGLARTPNKSANEMQVNKAKHVDVQDEVEIHNTSISEPGNGNKDATVSAHTQPAMVAKDFGELGFNVQLSNEAETPAQRVHVGIELGRGDDENIEGIGFFDGLEEYLSSLPGVLLP